VTASDDLIAKVTAVVHELDIPAAYVSSTWMRTFKYARADVVANQLGQVLGVAGNSTATGGALSGKTLSVSTSTSSSSLSSTTSSQTTANTSRASTLNLNAQGMNELQRMVNINNLSGSVAIVPFNDTNSVLVTCPPEDRALLNELFDQLDVMPKQVLVDALVVEAQLTKSDKLGFEWPSMATKFFGSNRSGGSGSTNFGYASDPTSNSTAAGLTYTLTAGQYSMFVQAINQDNNLHVVSHPSIFTTTNASGQITVGQSLPYETGSSTANADTTYTYGYMPIGLELTITPHVSADGYVTMDLTQTANELAGYDALLQNAPEVNERQATSTVSVKDGETVVLGGMIQDNLQDNTYKVPLLGDVPILGQLFKSNTKIDTKTELMIFLTPHVINGPGDANKLSKEAAGSLDMSHDMNPIQKKEVDSIEKSPIPGPIANVIIPRQTIEDLPPVVVPPATPTSPNIVPATTTTATTNNK
jgi:general secretion pathway protein D